MSVAQNQIITYGELVQLFLDKITSLCKNVGSYSGVPNEMKSGFTQTITRDKSSVVINVDANTVIPTVTASTISQQLNDYLELKGVKTKANTIMTTTSLLNFYNVAAAFVTAKVVLVTSYLTSTTVPMYKSNSTSWPTPPVIDYIDPSATPAMISDNKVKETVTFLEMFDRNHLISSTLLFLRLSYMY